MDAVNAVITEMTFHGDMRRFSFLYKKQCRY